MINNLSIDEFESYLRMRQCAENTIKSYSHTVQEFYKEYL